MTTQSVEKFEKYSDIPFANLLKQEDDSYKYVPDFSIELKELPLKVNFPNFLRDKIYYDTDNPENKLLIFRGAMSKGEKKELLKLSENSLYREAIESLFKLSNANTQKERYAIFGMKSIDRTIEILGAGSFHAGRSGQYVIEGRVIYKNINTQEERIIPGQSAIDSADRQLRILQEKQNKLNKERIAKGEPAIDELEWNSVEGRYKVGNVWVIIEGGIMQSERQIRDLNRELEKAEEYKDVQKKVSPIYDTPDPQKSEEQKKLEREVSLLSGLRISKKDIAPASKLYDLGYGVHAGSRKDDYGKWGHSLYTSGSIGGDTGFSKTFWGKPVEGTVGGSANVMLDIDVLFPTNEEEVSALREKLRFLETYYPDSEGEIKRTKELLRNAEGSSKLVKEYGFYPRAMFTVGLLREDLKLGGAFNATLEGCTDKVQDTERNTYDAKASILYKDSFEAYVRSVLGYTNEHGYHFNKPTEQFFKGNEREIGTRWEFINNKSLNLTINPFSLEGGYGVRMPTGSQLVNNLTSFTIGATPYAVRYNSEEYKETEAGILFGIGIEGMLSSGESVSFDLQGNLNNLYTPRWETKLTIFDRVSGSGVRFAWYWNTIQYGRISSYLLVEIFKEGKSLWATFSGDAFRVQVASNLYPKSFLSF